MRLFQNLLLVGGIAVNLWLEFLLMSIAILQSEQPNQESASIALSVLN